MAENNKLKRTQKRPFAVSDQAILSALLDSAVPFDSSDTADWVWKHLRFDPERLSRELANLLPAGHRNTKTSARTIARQLATQYELRQARVDMLRFDLLRRRWEVPRALVGEALGAFGSSLFHTRRRSLTSAVEAARELAYFGYGPPPAEAFSPLVRVRSWLSGETQPAQEPILLEEQNFNSTRHWSAVELLAHDPVYHGRPPRMADMGSVQKRLRREPLDGAMVSKLREFFSRRATAGVRDTMRWALGSRHPWFGWPRARDLIMECFERWGDENFFAWRTNVYREDPLIETAERARMLENNRRAVSLFAARLGSALNREPPLELSTERLRAIAELVLDHHYDYPDFDLEALGNQQGITTAHFVGHAATVFASHLRGDQVTPRRNRNIAGLFSSMDAPGRWLARFDDHQRERFFEIVREQLDAMQERGGLADESGELVTYQRPPMILLSFISAPTPQPLPHERVQDSFRLSQVRTPQFAGYLRSQPDLIEKLVVFFTLVLRHYLDHACLPNLRPKDWLRDYWLLGLWGDCAENVWVNLYQNKKTGEVRSEVRFLGGDQHNVCRPDQDHAREAELLHKAADILGPDPEQGALRALASFLMALQESQEGSRSAALDQVAIMKQTLEVFRETARSGVRGTLVDLATTFELVLDGAIDTAQRGLSRVGRWSSKLNAQRAPIKDA